MNVDGTAISNVPSFTFCIISLSLPNWLEPKFTTFAFEPNLLLASFTKCSAESLNKDPGSPT